MQRERWRRVEQMGFDHAWTYDHLAWRDLADEPWFATVPLLAAAAAVTAFLAVTGLTLWLAGAVAVERITKLAHSLDGAAEQVAAGVETVSMPLEVTVTEVSMYLWAISRVISRISPSLSVTLRRPKVFTYSGIIVVYSFISWNVVV